MKKYLMTVMAAVALGGLFAGCSKDADLSGGQNSAEFNIVQNYENAFITRFGQPHANQTWGFGESVAGTRSGNTSGDYVSYPATHEYKDASGKVIAAANMNHNEWADPNKEYGGWVVPDPLTEGQKLRVQKYFQANPNLSYKDPHYANFFIQQVYTGGTDKPTTGNQEATAAANGQVHAGSTLNQLTVGQACSHINDFNRGTCSESDVLDNDKTVNNGTYHKDQITLMVNVDDTSCFGYHETGGSNVKGVINHNDKMALVSAAIIDDWASKNGNPGEAVVDKWNRSFMGFDYELLPEEDIIPENPTYAKLSQVPNINNIQYAWDGEKVMAISDVHEPTPTTNTPDFDLFPYFANHASGSTNNGTATCTKENDKIVCYFPQYSSITFGQGNQDWSAYSKLVIEFEASPINGSVMNTSFSKDDTKVEVVLNNEHWWGDDQGPTISTYDGSTGTLNITSVKLIGKTIEGTTPDPNIVYYNPEYLLGDRDADKIIFYSSENTNMYGGAIIELSEDQMKTTQEDKTCLNLVKFKELADAGYHPISTDLKKWVKWQAACDGYYSDWIVTLTEAKRINDDKDEEEEEEEEETDDPSIVCRIIVEDLTVGENSDFDFNDVVFDVCHNGTLIIRAIGGELPIYIGAEGANEVHAACSVTLPANFNNNMGQNSHMVMRNTGWTSSGNKSNVAIDYNADLGHISLNRTFSSKDEARGIDIWVRKNGTNIKLEAPKGKVASMICVGQDFKWCAEREDIDRKFRSKNGTKLFQQYVIGNLGDKWENKTAWYQYRGKELPNN